MNTHPWLIAATVVFGLVPNRPEDSPPAPQVDPQVQDSPESAKSCGKCHTVIYEEWKDRKHSKAWDDELYQEKIATKRRPEQCHACHIPERVLARTGRKPRTRKENLHEGVTCVSCHEKDGAMHGPFDIETRAHETEKDPLFTPSGSNGLCASCHATKIDVVLPVARDFEDAGANVPADWSCIGCHMPSVTRHMSVNMLNGEPTGEVREGRSHAVLGPDDPEFCATAFLLSAKKADGRLVLSIENKAGHGVPGLRIRAFHFLLRQQNASGEQISDDQLVIDAENGLKILETRAFEFELADGATKVDIVVQHHFQDALVADIHKQTLELN